MREILFRGKSKKSKEWVEGHFLPYALIIRFQNSSTEGYEFNDVFRETVSEFTGRRDKNGKRIYENDIVEEAGGHRSVVKYSEEEAKFVLESKYVVTELGNKQVTVIGNIFDNKDLIENA